MERSKLSVKLPAQLQEKVSGYEHREIHTLKQNTNLWRTLTEFQAFVTAFGGQPARQANLSTCAKYQRRSPRFNERTAIFTLLSDALFLCWGGWMWYHLMYQIIYFQAARVFFPPFPKQKSVPVVTSHWLTCFQGFSHKRSTFVRRSQDDEDCSWT